MNKETKQKMTTSVYGTRIYLFFLTIINFIWLYCMEVKINLFSLISACIVFLILFLLYRREGKEYVLNIVQSNLFFSLFFLVFPFSFLALIAAVAKDFFLKSFVLWCTSASVSIFVFSALGGLIISFFPYQKEKVFLKIKFWTRLKIILVTFLILLTFYSLLHIILYYILFIKDNCFKFSNLTHNKKDNPET